jgi:hypothetical protein
MPYRKLDDQSRILKRDVSTCISSVLERDTHPKVSAGTLF